MATKLTTFSKLIITLLIVGGIGALIMFLGDSSLMNKLAPKEKEKQDIKGLMVDDVKDVDVIKVGVVTWGGYAGGQYFNEGFSASKESRFFEDYGFQVEFKVLDDFDASRAAFKSNDIHLLWATIDAFPTEVEGLGQYDPQVVFQADWSRGGDAVVVRRGINNVQDLKGLKIAVAPLTPSHTFLLWLLDAGGLGYDDVQIVEVANAIDAATAFKTDKVDAAVVWSPDDEICVRSVAGSKVLESTRNASYIIADVFYAKKKFIESNQDKLNKLFEGWMRGAAEINSSEANKAKASGILAEGLGITEEDALAAINNVRLCTLGDNYNFFGLNSDYKGVTGEDLYNKMGVVYNRLNYAPDNIPSWRLVANSSAVQAANIAGDAHAAEDAKVFTPVTEEDKTAPAIANKAITISFRTGEYQLDENAKYIIDKEFTPIAKAFGNARIRIEGNTDNVGSYTTNKSLSLRRAQSVADYLSVEHNMPRNRFIILGNGPDKPVADNSTESGRSKNRRTDFQLIGE
ncbi:MAG: OmpA family protein [Bacteroidetes bacterium]|nr:OmpA family protein [Bacteroidota bacterium]